MKNKKLTKWIVSLLTTVMLITCMSVPALAAADTPSLNLGEKGSVSVTLPDVKDGSLTLYEVATLGLDDGNMAYTKTDAFSGYEGDLNVEDTSLAGNLAEYVTGHSVTGTVANISSGGEVSFSDLTLGLYLIVQTEQSTGFYTIDPFLVTVPIAEDDQWVYHVNASPKTEVNPEPATSETMSIPVKVIWDDLEDKDNIRPDSATVVLEGTDGSRRSAVIIGTDISLLSVNGEDTGISVSTLAFIVNGSGVATLATATAGNSWNEDYDWDYVFEDLPIYDDNDAEIHYTLYEEEIEDYTITIEGDETTGFIVTNYHRSSDDSGTTSPSPSNEPTPGTTDGTGGNGGAGGTGGNSGTSGNGSTSKTLPQTGQLNWPIALFAILGVIFVVVGIVLVNTGRKRHREA